MKLLEDEISELLNTPESLAVLVDYHAVQETLADAFDYIESAQYHKKRGGEFKVLHDAAQAERAKRKQAPNTKRP